MVTYPKLKVAAAHVAPVFLDAARTTDKACALIREAARAGARLVAFPESFVPGFPVWAGVQAPIRNHDYFKRLAASSVSVPGQEVDRLRAAAREHAVLVSIGISERGPASVGCLWNSNLLIGEDGALLNHHRKLVPTFYEKLVWANGDGEGLRVCDTPVGRVGMLICGENTNPLARYALIAQGEQVHVSSYPPVWPTREPGEKGRYDLASAIRIRAGAHSFEGKLFNVVASAFLDRSALEALPDLDAAAQRTLRESPRGVSMVIGPSGEVLGDTLCEEEGLLYRDIDLADCVEPKQFHDIVGYYNRFDIFELNVRRHRSRPVAFQDSVELPAAAPGDSHGRQEDPDRDAHLPKDDAARLYRAV
ncbi:MAG: carbon-nitrogen hydrolase family protein [Burkholderiales bacterium]